MSEATSATNERSGREVEITVNKKPVKIRGPKVSGLLIKQAAIAQGVQIELDFELKQILGNREHKIIGDTDEVTINKNSKFVATASDDNS